MDLILMFVGGLLIGIGTGGFVATSVYKPKLEKVRKKWRLWENEYWYLRGFPENATKRLRFNKTGVNDE